ncbi:YfaZ family outer membrane protein [Halomonas sp. WWR20]
MRHTLQVLSAASLFALASQAQALSVNANAGPDSFGAEAQQTLLPGWQAGVGYLRSDDEDSDTHAYSAQLMFTPFIPGVDSGVDLGVGARYQYLDTRYGDGGGLGLGGHLYVDTPIPQVDVGGYGFFTPDGATHGDLESSYEYGLRARAHLVGNFYGYAGYRYLRSEFDNRDEETLNSGPVVGVSLGF